MSRWRILRRCVLVAMCGAVGGLVLALAAGVIVAYAVFPSATVYQFTGRGGALTSDVDRVWQILTIAAGCGVVAGVIVSQAVLVIETLQQLRPRGGVGAVPPNCEHCGYDFRGHASAAGAGAGSTVTCPECGKAAR